MTQTISTGEPEPEPDAEVMPRVGIALSGGGVRSAAFSYGALQALQSELGLVIGQKRAMFLSAVSGGSYTAAAILMAAGGVLNTPSWSGGGTRWDLSEEEPGADGHPKYLDEVEANSLGSQLVYGKPHRSSGWRSVPAPDPLRPGSTESDYLRVHARYLLEVAPLITVVQFAGLMLISVATVISFAMAGGLLAGSLWERAGDSLVTKVVFIAMIVATAYGAWFVADEDAKRRIRDASATRKREIMLREVVVGCGWLLVAGLIAVVYSANEDAIADWFGTSRENLTRNLLALGVVGSSVLGPTLMALVRAQTAPKTDSTSRPSRLFHVIRRVLIIVVEVLLAILVPVSLLAAFTLGWTETRVDLWGGESIGLAGLALVILTFVALIAWLFGDKALSPHALYRNRLARAFSMIHQEEVPPVGQPVVPEGASEGVSEEDPPPPQERTRARLVQPRLSDLARDDLPELLICASVNITEAGIAAAGSYARPIIFSPSWIYLAGEPSGFVPTAAYEQTIGRQNRWFRHSFDATVMSYVALTAAAVSPSMGKYTKYWLRATLGLLNLRLGTWIPNPASPIVADDVAKGEFVPGLNRCPGVLLRLRELRGRHYIRSRHIFVSDGGHYENLGIVELIRRGCDEVWAIDASDDDRGTWRTLSESLNLIASELGCVVTGDFSNFETPRQTEDGSRPADARLINETYADVHISGLRDGTPYQAVIHVVKLGMSAATNPVVAQLGTKYRKFPYDSTLNQLYTAERFDLYRALGYDSTSRAIGDVAPHHATSPTN